MNSIWNYFKNLFIKLDQSSPSQAYIHETIKRSEEEKESYQEWKQSLATCEVLNWLHTQGVQHQINPNTTNDSIEFLNSPSIEGFVVNFSNKKYPREELIHLFDLLKERVLELGYNLYMSDLRTYRHLDGIETVQRHYLKPRLRTQDFPQQKIDQQYGNITIQLIERNDRIEYLKFNASKYRDHLYQEAAAFEELLTALLA